MKCVSFPATLAVSTLGFLSACSSSVTPSKLNRIAPGMKVDQVDAALGLPTRVEESEITGMTGKVYHYVSPAGDARVIFVNDFVFKTAFVPEGKSS